MPFTTGNFYLTLSQMQENAQYWKTLCNTICPEWSFNSICGMLGNFQKESTINPGIWQDLTIDPDNLGYGLAQWTPGKKYINWCESNGYVPEHMNSAILRIIYELENNLQWIKTTLYDISFEEFFTGSYSVEYCASAWLHNYERPEVYDDSTRREMARYWYSFLSGEEPPDPPDPPGPPTPIANSGFKFIYYMKRRKPYGIY